MAYTKLFQSIITSTIWTEDDKTRIVWITMLALSDKNGEIAGSVPGIARMAGVSVEAASAAIRKFLSPDEYSRTKDDEGRRIQEIDGGWSLLNHRKYRDMASREDQRVQNAIRQERFQAKKKRNNAENITENNANITPDNAEVTDDLPIQIQIQTQITDISSTKKILSPKARARDEAEVVDFVKSLGLTESDGSYIWHSWEANGWKRGSEKIKCWQSAARAWHKGQFFPSQKSGGSSAVAAPKTIVSKYADLLTNNYAQ